MCVCVYVCVYECVCVYVCMCTRYYIYVLMYICILCVCMQACTRIHIHLHTYTYISSSLFLCVFSHLYMHTYIYTRSRRPIGCLICIDYFPLNSTMINGFFAEKDPAIYGILCISPIFIFRSTSSYICI